MLSNYFKDIIIASIGESVGNAYNLLQMQR